VGNSLYQALESIVLAALQGEKDAAEALLLGAEAEVNELSSD
jgi:hypothetical protein